MKTFYPDTATSNTKMAEARHPKAVPARKLLLVLVLVALPMAMEAQFMYETNTTKGNQSEGK